MKKIRDFILVYYYSFLLCLFSFWLALTLLSVGHYLLSGVLTGLVVVKMIGIFLQKDKFRIIGLVGLNAMWAVNTYIFIAGYHPNVELTFQFPLLMLFIGAGIGFRGRFNE